MNMIRLFAAMMIAFAFQLFAAGFAETPLDPGVPLKAPKNATLTAIAPMPNTLIGWEVAGRRISLCFLPIRSIFKWPPVHLWTKHFFAITF